LHGIGFADALSRLELPQSEFLTTLVGFNVGVEAGQLTIIAAASIAVSLSGPCRLPGIDGSSSGRRPS
jgi:hypothetical protein